MNSKRRTRLREGIDILGEVIDGEQEAFDNMPENIRDAEKGQAVEEGLDSLNEAKDLLDGVASSLVIIDSLLDLHLDGHLDSGFRRFVVGLGLPRWFASLMDLRVWGTASPGLKSEKTRPKKNIL